MASSIIKFFTGNTYELGRLTQGLNQYIALNTQTGQMFWNHNGSKYYMNCGADWNESDSTSPNYVKNKPFLTVADLVSTFDLSQIPDATNMLVTYRLPISATMVNVNDGHYTIDLGTRHPTGIITSRSIYSIEPDTVTLDQNNSITLQLNNYMAYQNVTSVPNNWAVYYA